MLIYSKECLVYGLLKFNKSCCVWIAVLNTICIVELGGCTDIKSVIQVLCLFRSVGKLTSGFCFTLERAGDWLQSREKPSSTSSQAESKQKELLMPWIIRKMFHP